MKIRQLQKMFPRWDVINYHEIVALEVRNTSFQIIFTIDKETLDFNYTGVIIGLKNPKCSLSGLSKSEIDSTLDELKSLYESGVLHDIIHGKDAIENAIPLYWVNDDTVLKTKTDPHEPPFFPKYDDNGDMISKGTHFYTKNEAIEKAILQRENSLKDCKERIKNENFALKMNRKIKASYIKQIENLIKQKDE